MTQDDAETMLEASLAEISVLNQAIGNIIDASGGPLESELALTASQSGGVWAPFGRLVILTAYTAMERLIVSFAIERRVSDSELLSWLFRDPMDEEPKETFRIPELKKGIEGRRPEHSLEQFESRFLKVLENAGFAIDSNLAKRIVALKTLRNDCAHVRAARPDEHLYRTAAGFSESVLALHRKDIILALRTVGETIDVFGKTWLPDFLLTESSERKRKMERRIELMSDLPIYLQTMIDRLEASRDVGRDA